MLKILPIIMERTQICGIHMWMLNAFVLLCSSYVRCQYEGDIRLVDGPTLKEGRVEIYYYSGQWGTVCDDSWDNNDASVVCRQLGYSSVGAVARLHAYYGEGSDPIHLVDVNCTGYETTLNYCSSTRLDRWGIEKCEHYKDAGVSCSEHEGDIRLVGGFTSHEGRVEIYHSGQWGTVCDNNWDNTDASVVCRQLGYSSGNTTHRYYGRGSGPIHLDGVNCTGNESRLTSCGSSEWGVENCAFYDARVSCSYDYAEGTIRLVDGSTPNQGRVEIFHNGQWGTVCDDGWNEDEAIVVCRQLGYTGPYAYARSNAYYGQGSGPIHLDEVFCFGYGSESRLTQCSHEPWGINDCDHGDDAGVHCGYVPTTVAPQPTVSSKVVGMMSFVGVSLFLLTLAAIGAVCYTCYPSKPAVRTSPSEQLPLSNIANTTPAAPTTSGITYPSDPTQPSMPPPSQLPTNAYPAPAESAPPSAPPAYSSLQIAHP